MVTKGARRARAARRAGAGRRRKRGTQAEAHGALARPSTGVRKGGWARGAPRCGTTGWAACAHLGVLLGQQAVHSVHSACF